MCFCSNTKPSFILEDDEEKEDDYADTIGWAKARMWSQYGDSHYGSCIVVSKPLLEKYINETYKDKTKPEVGFVKYDQKKYSAMRYDVDTLKHMDIKKYACDYVRDNFRELLLTKYIDYRDESEYRVIVYDLDGKNEYISIRDYVKGVIIGDRTPEVYFRLIGSLCEKLKIGCLKIHWKGLAPSLIGLPY